MRGRGILPTRNSKNMYRCFCCFHVRSGALALGTWHLMIHLFAICLLAYMSANMDDINSVVSRGNGQIQSQTLTIYIKRANFSASDSAMKNSNTVHFKSVDDVGEKDETLDADNDADSDEPIAMPVSMKNPSPPASGLSSSSGGAGGSEIQLKNGDEKVGSNSASIVIRSGTSGSPPSPSTGSNGVTYYWSSFIFNTAGQPILTQRDLNLAFLLGCVTVSISLMMVVGIIKGRPFYLIPFLTYQIMDLIISVLTVAGFVCYGPELRDYMLSDSDFPFREELAEFDNQWVTLIVAVAILSVVFVKAYFVQVIWLCVRYMKEEKVRRAREECQPKVIYLDNNNVDPELTVFMFDDEGSVVKKVPPPAYDTVSFGTASNEEEKTAPPAYTPTTA